MFNVKMVMRFCEDLAIVKECHVCGAYDDTTAAFEVTSLIASASKCYADFHLIDAMGKSIIDNVAMNVLDNEKGYSFDELPEVVKEFFTAQYFNHDFIPEWFESYKRITADSEMLKRQCL